MSHNSRISASLLLTLLPIFMAGCEVIEGIFKVGMWVGIIIVVLIVLVISWILRKLKGPRV